MYAIRSYYGTLSNIGFYIIAGGIGMMIALPLYWMIITSIKTQTAIFTYPIEWFPSEITFENFVITSYSIHYTKLYELPGKAFRELTILQN